MTVHRILVSRSKADHYHFVTLEYNLRHKKQRPKMRKETKREQPRNAKGEFGSLPNRVPQAQIARPVATTFEVSPTLEISQKDIAGVYAKFKASNGRSPIIGLDLDGTTANMVHGLRAHVAQKRGIAPEEANTQLPEPGEYDFITGETAWFANRDEFLEYFLQAEKDGMYRNLPSYAGALEVLQALIDEGFEIKVVTARSADFNHDTAHWLASQGFPQIPIFNPGTEKHTLEDIDIFIDDAPHVINKLVERDRKVIIFNQDYNGHQVEISETHTRRITGWSLPNLVTALNDLL